MANKYHCGVGCELSSLTKIAAGARLGNYVITHGEVHIGKGCVVQDFAVIGKKPLASKAMYRRVPKTGALSVTLGERVIVGTRAIIYTDVVVGDDTLIGDGANVRERCRIGNRVLLSRNVCLNDGVEIGDRVEVMDGSYLVTNCVVGEGAFLGIGLITTNDNTMKPKPVHVAPRIEKGASLGSGVAILPGVVIAADCTVGAGAVVTHDTEPGKRYAGVPARELS